MLCRGWLVFSSSDWRISILAVSCSLGGPLSHGSPTFRGSLSIHIFMLLFRFIAESSVFSSDFTRESNTAIEIGAPFEEMCETFLLFSAEKRTVALIPIIVL